MSGGWTLVVDGVWLLFLLSLLIYFWRQWRRAKKVLLWKKTTAQVVACDWSQEGHVIWPKIQYSYEVEGGAYMGEHLFFDTRHNTPNSAYARRIAYKVAKAFKDNQPIDIYYNPKHPDLAAVDTQIPRKIIGILWFLLGLFMMHLGVMVIRYYGFW